MSDLMLSQAELAMIRRGYNANPAASLSLRAEAYVEHRWFEADMKAIIGKTWQWICHAEKLREPGSYVATQVAENPILIVRNKDHSLRAFYNVCKHRAMQLYEGEGKTSKIMCPYHAWTYDLGGQLVRAPETDHLVDFEIKDICLDQVQVEEFCGFIYVNLDLSAPSLSEQSGALGEEINHWAPDANQLTFAHRLTYEIKSNWKNVIDNFLECYHCPIAHKDFVSLVDMDTYKVTTHGIYSSHMAEAGKSGNTAYSVEHATVTDHAVWWLWPNTCIMRYPGRGNMIIMNVIPAGPNRTLETYDFFLESAEPIAAELESIQYLDEVLQAEDIWLVENVQRGMETPAFEQGRIVHDPSGSGKSEHAVHHFHGLVLDAYQGICETAA